VSKDAYAKYASRAERELDELWEAHLNYLCDHATCSWCIANEVEQMSAYINDQHMRCPLCDARNIEVRYVEYPADFTGYWHVGDLFKCSNCGAEGEYDG